MKKILCSAVLTTLLLFGAVLAHASSAGMVLTVNSGAWVLRDGKKVELNVKSEVFKGDEIVTDATGRVQVIFADDTTISLGADTTVAVSDFVFDAPGGKASFSADMAKGMARFVTGKVVEKNRSGFSVTTPQATVGIRGTTFAVNVSPKGVTSVIGLDVKSAFPISVANKATGAIAEIKTSGMAVDAAPSGNTSYQTPPGQFSQSSSSVNGKSTAAASGDDSGQGSGQASTQTATQVAGQAITGTTTASSGTATAAASAAAPATGSLYTPELSGGAQALTNSAGQSAEKVLADLGGGSGLTPPSVTPPPGPTLSASWSGNIFQPSSGINAGTFSFDTSLTAGSGSMTNAQIVINNGYGDGLVANQLGSSTVTGGAFDTTLQVATPPLTGPINAGNLGNIAGNITGNSTSGSWTIKENSGNDMFGAGPGSFTGTKN